MREVNFFVISVALLSSVVYESFGASDTHLESLRKAYPYGLLGEDYGLLTVDDLAFNACIAIPVPISKESDFYPYWRCFKTRDITFECDHRKEQGSILPKQALMVLVVGQSLGKEEYLAPGMMDLKSCREYEKDWNRLAKKEKYACISGALIRFDRDKKREYEAHWTFDKLKTRKGCISYFSGDCDVRRKISPCEGV